MIRRYLHERAAWFVSGNQNRTEEEIGELFEICSGRQSGEPCEHFQWIRKRKKLGRCRKCGCGLNLGETLNKLRWATTNCPDIGTAISGDLSSVKTIVLMIRA